MADIFDLQDQITERIVGALEPTIRSVEVERARRKRPDNLDAYDCVMRALSSIWVVERDANAEALVLNRVTSIGLRIGGSDELQRLER